MINCRQSILLLLTLLLIGSSLELSSQDCKDQLRATYKALGEEFVLRAGKVSYLELETRMKPRGGGEWVSTTLKVYANPEKSFLISDQVEVYQDGEATVTVIPSQQKITIAGAEARGVQLERLSGMFAYQDSMFYFAMVTDCQDLRGGKQRVELRFEGRGAELLQTERLVVVHRPGEKRLERLHRYLRNHPQLEEQLLIFRAVSADGGTTILRKTAVAQVLDGRGQLREAYRGFDLVDLRNSGR